MLCVLQNLCFVCATYRKYVAMLTPELRIEDWCSNGGPGDLPAAIVQLNGENVKNKPGFCPHFYVLWSLLLIYEGYMRILLDYCKFRPGRLTPFAG